MRDTISHFKLKLAEAEEDTSCAALNRLRAKLRELMKDGQKADQQVSVVVERSMQTVDLSESYENLRIENERLQAELMQIRRSIKDVAVPILKDSVAPPSIDEEEIDTSMLRSRLQNCEVLLAELKTHLDEKTAYAESLKSELEEQKASAALALDMDQVTVSRKDTEDEISIKNASLHKEVRETQEELERMKDENNELRNEIDKLNVNLRLQEEKFQVVQEELGGCERQFA